MIAAVVFSVSTGSIMVTKLPSTSHGLAIIRTCCFRLLLSASLYFYTVLLHCLRMCQGTFINSDVINLKHPY